MNAQPDNILVPSDELLKMLRPSLEKHLRETFPGLSVQYIEWLEEGIKLWYTIENNKKE